MNNFDNDNFEIMETCDLCGLRYEIFDSDCSNLCQICFEDSMKYEPENIFNCIKCGEFTYLNDYDCNIDLPICDYCQSKMNENEIYEEIIKLQYNQNENERDNNMVHSFYGSVNQNYDRFYNNSNISHSKKVKENIKIEEKTINEIFDKFDKNKQLEKKENVLYITPYAYNQLRIYTNLVKTEICGFGRVQKDTNGNNIVTEIKLYEQIVSGTKAEGIDGSSYYDFMQENDLWNECHEWFFQWHTHPTFSTSPSGTDKQNVIDQLNDGYVNGFIDLIFNQKDEYSCRYTCKPKLAENNFHYQPKIDEFYQLNLELHVTDNDNEFNIIENIEDTIDDCVKNIERYVFEEKYVSGVKTRTVNNTNVNNTNNITKKNENIKTYTEKEIGKIIKQR